MNVGLRSKEARIAESLQMFGSHIYRVTDKIFDYFEDNEQEEMIKICKDTMLKCCNAGEEFKNNFNHIKETAAILRQEDNERIAKDIYRELKQEKPYKEHEEHEMYKNLEKVISTGQKRAAAAQGQEVEGEEEEMDEDLQMTAMHFTTKDPFTQKEMTDPVMSSKCKHTYERSSVMAMIGNKTRIKCPTPGCGWISVDDLVPNFDMKRIIEERQANMRS